MYSAYFRLHRMFWIFLLLHSISHWKWIWESRDRCCSVRILNIVEFATDFSRSKYKPDLLPRECHARLARNSRACVIWPIFTAEDLGSSRVRDGDSSCFQINHHFLCTSQIYDASSVYFATRNSTWSWEFPVGILDSNLRNEWWNTSSVHHKSEAITKIDELRAEKIESPSRTRLPSKTSSGDGAPAYSGSLTPSQARVMFAWQDYWRLRRIIQAHGKQYSDLVDLAYFALFLHGIWVLHSSKLREPAKFHVWRFGLMLPSRRGNGSIFSPATC